MPVDKTFELRALVILIRWMAYHDRMGAPDDKLLMRLIKQTIQVIQYKVDQSREFEIIAKTKMAWDRNADR